MDTSITGHGNPYLEFNQTEVCQPLKCNFTKIPIAMLLAIQVDKILNSILPTYIVGKIWKYFKFCFPFPFYLQVKHANIVFHLLIFVLVSMSSLTAFALIVEKVMLPQITKRKHLPAHWTWIAYTSISLHSHLSSPYC